ncbi:MAG: pilin [bacterium]|nr:pilin [bacterium]
MRTILLTLLVSLGLGLTFAFPAVTLAAEFNPFDKVCDDETRDAAVCNANKDNPISGQGGIILRIVNILSFVVGVATVIMVVLGGLKYVNSGGDANATSSAKNTILYAIIGAVVFILSRAIIEFVLNRT